MERRKETWKEESEKCTIGKTERKEKISRRMEDSEGKASSIE